jgi:hypothetical protein
MKSFGKLAAMFAYAASNSRTRDAQSEPLNTAAPANAGDSPITNRLLADENTLMQPEAIHFENSTHDVATPTRRTG